MFPGETEWGDGFGGTLFGTPSEKESKRKKGHLELEPPDFDIPHFGGGDIRKRYPLQFKMNAVRYSQKRVKGAQGPGGSVGISYPSRVLGIPDMATLALWVKKIDEMEAELSQAAQKGGTKGKKKAQKRMSLTTGRIKSNADADLEIVAWMNDLRSDSISARVNSNGKAQGFGTQPERLRGEASAVRPRGQHQVQEEKNNLVHEVSQAVPLFCASRYLARPETSRWLA